MQSLAKEEVFMKEVGLEIDFEKTGRWGEVEEVPQILSKWSGMELRGSF